MSDAQTLEPTETPAEPNPGMDAIALSKAAQEAHDREVYRRLANATETDEPAAPTGKPSPTPKAKGEQPQASKPASNAKAAATPEPSDDAGTKRRELIEIANAVLRRDGMKDKAREHLISGLDDDELQEMVAHRRKVQADADRLGNKYAELERKQPGPKSGASATEDQQSQRGDAGGEGSEFEGLNERQIRIVQTIRDEGDTERADEVLLAFREGAAERLPPRGQKDGSGGEPANRAGVSAEAEIAAAEARLLVQLREPLDKLIERYPSMKFEGDRKRVLQTADRLTRAGVFDGENPTIDAILEKAATVALGSEDTKSAQRRLMARNTIERNGQPSRAGTRTSAPPKPLTREERERAAYRRLQEGETPEQVQQSFRG